MLCGAACAGVTTVNTPGGARMNRAAISAMVRASDSLVYARRAKDNDRVLCFACKEEVVGCTPLRLRIVGVCADNTRSVFAVAGLCGAVVAALASDTHCLRDRDVGETSVSPRPLWAARPASAARPEKFRHETDMVSYQPMART